MPNPLSPRESLELDVGNATLLLSNRIEYLMYRLDGSFRVYVPGLGWYGPGDPATLSEQIKRDTVRVLSQRDTPSARHPAEACLSAGRVV
jgi:hypothetical protein